MHVGGVVSGRAFHPQCCPPCGLCDILSRKACLHAHPIAAAPHHYSPPYVISCIVVLVRIGNWVSGPPVSTSLGPGTMHCNEAVKRRPGAGTGIVRSSNAVALVGLCVGVKEVIADESGGPGV